MKQQFEDYITRSRKIRSLSMPPEETEAYIGEIYRLFNENFAKIKVLLAENKKILERDVFRPLKNTDKLTKEELEEFKDFARALANTRTLEMVDVQLAWLILRDLYYYYKKQYEENGDESVLEEYIFCIFKVVTVSYNVIQSSDKGRATNKLNDVYRSVSIEAAETAKDLMQNPELFARLSTDAKENLLGTLLFRPSIHERLYYDEEMVRRQIVCYEEYLQIVRDSQIRAAAPEINFEFEEFSANSYIELTGGIPFRQYYENILAAT